VTAKIPVPSGAARIPNYRQESELPTKITYYAIVDDFSSREEPADLARRHR
jgi:hypothetical protein